MLPSFRYIYKTLPNDVKKNWEGVSEIFVLLFVRITRLFSEVRVGQ